VSPGGTIGALRNVSGGGGGGGNGKGSTLERNVTVALKGEDNTPGSCPSGATSGLVNVTLVLINDAGDTILDRDEPARCKSGDTTYVKFPAEFEGPRDCKGGAAPRNVSRGDVAVAVTTSPDNGSLDVTRSILCKADFNN